MFQNDWGEITEGEKIVSTSTFVYTQYYLLLWQNRNIAHNFSYITQKKKIKHWSVICVQGNSFQPKSLHFFGNLLMLLKILINQTVQTFKIDMICIV